MAVDEWQHLVGRDFSSIIAEMTWHHSKQLPLAVLLLSLALSCTSPGAQEVPRPDRPNIVLIIVDDMGWQDTSVPFWTEKTSWNRRYRTPHMERLARQGVKAKQAYATAVCSPSRISLLTGMNAARHRVTNWTLYRDHIQPMESEHADLDFPTWNVNGMSIDTAVPLAVHADPLPALLRASGYTTIHVGKAHLGAIGTPGEDPLNIGFDVNVAGHAAGAPQSFYGLDNFGNLPQHDGSPWPVPGLDEYHGIDIYLDQALANKAIEALDKTFAHRKPFFLHFSLYGIHTPIMPDHRYYSHYLEAGLDTVEAKYASMIEGADKAIGDILDYLDQNDLTANTLVMLISDNGGLSAHTRAGEKHTHNSPLSSGKGSVREGGIRVPMMARWPGVFSAGTTCDVPLIIEDFFPSLLEAAQVDYSHVRQKVDGISFLPVLRGEKQPAYERILFWHYPNAWGPTGPGIGAYSAVRRGNWKLIYYHQHESFELFDLAEDIGETDNLESTHADVRDELAEVLTKYLKKVDAQMPRHKSSGRVVSWPTDAIKAKQLQQG